MVSTRTFGLLLRKIPKSLRTSVRHHNYDGEAYSKTNLSLLTKEDESHTYIQAFSPHGFRLTSGFQILGPCALFPRAFLHWNIPSAEKITPASLALFLMLEPKPDILLIGKGDWDAQIDKNIIKYLRSKHINLEILPTEQACSTFNFLNSERRVVAAGLIPPTNVEASNDKFMIESEAEIAPFKDPDTYPDDFPEVTKTMESFRDEGIYTTVAKNERNRKRSQPGYRPGDENIPEEEQDKKKPD